MSERKKKKSKKICQKASDFFTPMRRRILLAFFSIIAIAITSWLTWPSFFELHKESVDGEVDYLPYRLQEGDVLTQAFMPTRDGLSSFLLSFDQDRDFDRPESTKLLLEFFSLDSLATESPDLSISTTKPGEETTEAETPSLDDEEKTIISEMVHQPIYAFTIDGKEINRYVQTELPLLLNKESKQHEYELVITVLEQPTDQSLYIHTNSAQARPMLFNGKETGLALSMSLNYSRFNWRVFRIALILMIILVALYLLPYQKVGEVLTGYPAFTVLFAPFIILIQVELFNTLNYAFWLGLPVVVISYLIILLIGFILTGLTGRLRAGLYLNQVLFAGLAIGNHSKLFFRGDPFVAGDLRILTEAIQTVNNLRFVPGNRFLLGWLLILIYLVLFLDVDKRTETRKQRLIAIGVPIVSFLVFMNVLVLRPSNMDRFFGISRYPWNNMMNYKQNGFTIPFFQSVHQLVITPPENFKPVKASVYELPADTVSDQPSGEKPHIVAIMSESYADFNNIHELETSEPVMPFYDWLCQQPETISGNLLVSVFGGGTCNTEFEFLTGSSMLFISDGITPYTSYFKRTTHALPDIYRQQGYKTLAIHPFYRTFWDRDQVYPQLGFDRFIALDEFPEGGEVRQFKGDQAAFDQIKQALSENQAGQRQFIFTVTMQNHFPYYGEEEILADLDYNIKVPGMIDVEAVELYLSILRESDDALKDLYLYLNQLDEPVMLVFFGDHLPGNNNVFNNFYQEMFEKPITDLSPAETQKLYETPYFIWTNYDLTAQTTLDLEDYRHDLTSPNFLAANLLTLSDSALSEYFTFVSDLQSDIKAMNNRLLITEAGRRVNHEQIPRNLTKPLEHYWRYEYDNIIAKKESD